jgi:hypothetical protein
MPQATVDQRAVSFTEPASKMTPVKGPTTADYFASNASGPLEGGGGSGTNPEFDEVTLTRTKLSKADILKATWSTDSQVNKEINDFEKKLFGQKRDEKGYLIGPQQKEADETFDEAQFAVDNQDALSNYTDDEKKQYERIEKALEWQHEMFGDKGHDLRSWLEAQGISFQLPETRKKFFDIVSNHYEALRQFRLGTKGGWNFNALNTAVMRNMFGKEFVLSIDDLNKRYDFKKDIFEEKQQDALLKHFADEQRLTAVREAFRAQQQAGGK